MTFKNLLFDKNTINLFLRGMQISGKYLFLISIYIFSANRLSVEEFGLLTFFLSLVFLFTLFVDFGTNAYFYRNLVGKNKKDKKFFLAEVLGFLIIQSSLISLLFLIYNIIFLNNIIFLLILLLIFIIPLVMVMENYLMNLKEFKLLTKIYYLLIPIFIFILFLSYSLYFTIFIYSLYYISIFIIYYILINPKFKLSIINFLDIFKHSFIYGFIVISAVALYQVDFLFLGHFSYYEELAHYNLFFKIVSTFFIPLIIFIQVFLPLIREKFINNDKYILSSFKKYNFFTFILGLFLALSLFILIPILFNVFFKEYDLNLYYFLFLLIILILPFRFISFINYKIFITSQENFLFFIYLLIILILIKVLSNIYIFLFSQTINLMFLITFLLYLFESIFIYITLYLKLK